MAGRAQESRGGLGPPRSVSSPITSDEEYLSPQEEALDPGLDPGPPASRRVLDALFKEPPAFLVRSTETAQLL